MTDSFRPGPWPPTCPDTIRRAVGLLDGFDVTDIYGAWWGRVVRGDGSAALRRSAQRYLRHLGM